MIWYAVQKTREDKHFSELMACFLRCMKAANEDGGLYIDGIVSK